jgi:hypothetical protein
MIRHEIKDFRGSSYSARFLRKGRTMRLTLICGLVPLVTGEYELSGKSRAASTAKRTVGGAAVGSIIGAIAGGGRARPSERVLLVPQALHQKLSSRETKSNCQARRCSISPYSKAYRYPYNRTKQPSRWALSPGSRAELTVL